MEKCHKYNVFNVSVMILWLAELFISKSEILKSDLINIIKMFVFSEGLRILYASFNNFH